MSGKRQKTQLRLAFGEERRSEAPRAPGEGSKTLTAKRMFESPAGNDGQRMEEVCGPNNCLQVLKRVKSNKGSAGIYVRSRAAGERVERSITRFIVRRLRLKVNEQKSAVARPVERKFLGFSFTANGQKRRIAPKAIVRFKRKVRELTCRTRGISLEQMRKELADYLQGWKAYFGFCQTPSVLGTLDQWLRRRLRAVIWKQWKGGTVRYRKLCERGVRRDLAAHSAGNSREPWRIANSPAMTAAFPMAYFDSRGLPRMLIAT